MISSRLECTNLNSSIVDEEHFSIPPVILPKMDILPKLAIQNILHYTPPSNDTPEDGRHKPCIGIFPLNKAKLLRPNNASEKQQQVATPEPNEEKKPRRLFQLFKSAPIMPLSTALQLKRSSPLTPFIG